MKIAIVGTGYVGLVTGTCFAEIGVDVTCVDTNIKKIKALEEGVIPIYEPGLEEMVLRNTKSGRLKFTTSLESCLNDVEVIFSAVGTPLWSNSFWITLRTFCAVPTGTVLLVTTNLYLFMFCPIVRATAST